MPPTTAPTRGRKTTRPGFDIGQGYSRIGRIPPQWLSEAILGRLAGRYGLLSAFAAAVYAVDGNICRRFPVDHLNRFYVFLLRLFVDFVGTAHSFAHVVRPTDELPNTPCIRT
jgi:hypothetical protein